MKTAPLGRTRVQIPRVILGCGNFGGIGSDPRWVGRGTSAEDAFAIMDAAVDMGIAVFDTANSYGGGESERIIGRWLKSRGPAQRSKVLIATRVGEAVGPGRRDRGLSPAHIASQVDASRRRLGVDTIDLYLTCHADPETPVEVSLAALDGHVARGAVRFIGACNRTAAELDAADAASRAAGTVRFEWVQNQYSLLERGDEQSVHGAIARLGLGYTPYSTLAGGVLSGKYAVGGTPSAGSRVDLFGGYYGRYLTDSIAAGIGALAEHAAERGVSVAALAMAWVMNHPLATAVLVGPRRPAHMESVRQALTLKLDPSERATLGRLFTRTATPEGT